MSDTIDELRALAATTDGTRGAALALRAAAELERLRAENAKLRNERDAGYAELKVRELIHRQNVVEAIEHCAKICDDVARGKYKPSVLRDADECARHIRSYAATKEPTT